MFVRSYICSTISHRQILCFYSITLLFSKDFIHLETCEMGHSLCTMITSTYNTWVYFDANTLEFVCILNTRLVLLSEYLYVVVLMYLNTCTTTGYNYALCISPLLDYIFNNIHIFNNIQIYILLTNDPCFSGIRRVTMQWTIYMFFA